MQVGKWPSFVQTIERDGNVTERVSPISSPRLTSDKAPSVTDVDSPRTVWPKPSRALPTRMLRSARAAKGLCGFGSFGRRRCHPQPLSTNLQQTLRGRFACLPSRSLGGSWPPLAPERELNPPDRDSHRPVGTLGGTARGPVPVGREPSPTIRPRCSDDRANRLRRVHLPSSPSYWCDPDHGSFTE